MPRVLSSSFGSDFSLDMKGMMIFIKHLTSLTLFGLFLDALLSDLTLKTFPDPSLQSKLSVFALCQTISIIIHPGNNTSKTSQLSETLIGMFYPFQAYDWLIRALLTPLLVP